MQTPLQITFRDMTPSAALEDETRDALRKLEEHHDRLTACRVVIQAPHKHQHQGRRFQVTVDVAVPGREIVVARSHEDRASHEDAHLALREAFRAARRALDSHLQLRRAHERRL
jgi:ribosome-associated translation inhibitor RaiA